MFMTLDNIETIKIVTDKNKRLEACIAVGLECWIDYCLTENGKECMKKLPTDRVRERAADLFLLGFCCRMLVAPPIGLSLTDRMTEEKDFNRLWIDHLETSGGEIILDGKPYPRTEEIVLLVAKAFFRLGFQSATTVWQQLREQRISS